MLDKVDKGQIDFQNIRQSYASELHSLWKAQGKAGVGFEIWDAYKVCGYNR